MGRRVTSPFPASRCPSPSAHRARTRRTSPLTCRFLLSSVYEPLYTRFWRPRQPIPKHYLRISLRPLGEAREHPQECAGNQGLARGTWFYNCPETAEGGVFRVVRSQQPLRVAGEVQQRDDAQKPGCGSPTVQRPSAFWLAPNNGC